MVPDFYFSARTLPAPQTMSHDAFVSQSSRKSTYCDPRGGLAVAGTSARNVTGEEVRLIQCTDCVGNVIQFGIDGFGNFAPADDQSQDSDGDDEDHFDGNDGTAFVIQERLQHVYSGPFGQLKKTNIEKLENKTSGSSSYRADGSASRTVRRHRSLEHTHQSRVGTPHHPEEAGSFRKSNAVGMNHRPIAHPLHEPADRNFELPHAATMCLRMPGGLTHFRQRNWSASRGHRLCHFGNL
jgi:hypothetical protein